ncbi:MAG: tRNA epoxyqueuosine(34) reductase QueG [Armatimonadota bacterium]
MKAGASAPIHTVTSSQRLARAVKERALELGFDFVGIAPALPSPHAKFFAEWLGQGFAGDMAYLARDPARRADPRSIVPGAKSVVSLAVSYHSGDPPERQTGFGRVARYAWSRDYHEVLVELLDKLTSLIRRETGGAACKAYCDTGPVLERDFAMLAGIGWIGKNTCLVNPQAGSWLFLAEVITEAEMEPDPPMPDLCGTCQRCLDACPTGALVAPRCLDARRCISYLTIELKAAVPRELRPLIGDRIFGCDLCQEVCPYNRRPVPSRLPSLQPDLDLSMLCLAELLNMSEEAFRSRFRHSPIMRAKRRGLQRNAAVSAGAQKDRSAVPALATAIENREPLVRMHAAWALGQMDDPHAERTLSAALGKETDPDVRREIVLALTHS